MNHPLGQFFQFEADFVESLRCIPMQVRFKLDTCGIKLKLQQWHQFSAVQRQQLVDLGCETEAEIANYQNCLSHWVLALTGDAVTQLAIQTPPPWLEISALPTAVSQKAMEMGVTLTLEQWRSLSPLHRFVLIKLSRSSHENKNFLPALEEFRLL
jgi:hypothetical protein